MKQILLYTLVLIFLSCKAEEKKAKMIESFKKELVELKKQEKIIEELLRKDDSLISEIQLAIKKNKFIPDSIIINEKYSLNPFELKEPILKKLFKSDYSTVDTTLFNNRHVDYQIDTVFTFKYATSFIEIYKNVSEEFIMNGFSNSDILNLKNNLRYGMEKSDFFKLIPGLDSASESHNNFRIQNAKTTQNVDFKFEKGKLKYIYYHGHFD